MTERERIPFFGYRVTAPYAPMDIQALQNCYNGISKQIVNERFPDRKKQLKAIRKEIQILIKDL